MSSPDDADTGAPDNSGAPGLLLAQMADKFSGPWGRCWCFRQLDD